MRRLLSALLFAIFVAATSIHADSFCGTCDAVGASDQDAPGSFTTCPPLTICRQFLYDAFARATSITPSSYTIDWHMVGESPKQLAVFDYSYTFRPASIIDPGLGLPPGVWLVDTSSEKVTNSNGIGSSLGGIALEDSTGASFSSSGCTIDGETCGLNRMSVFDIQVSIQGEPWLITSTGSFAVGSPPPVSTPEPSSLLLLGTGILGLIASRKFMG